MRKRSLVMPVVIAMLSGCAAQQAAAPATPADSGTLTVKLIAFNDFHGHLEAPNSSIAVADPADPDRALRIPAGGVEYLSTLVRQLKAQNPRNAVVAAGDLVGASPLISALFHDEPTIEALNQLGLEFSSVGNHEFDDGSSELSRLQNGGCLSTAGAEETSCRNGSYKGAAFQYLSANVIDRRSAQPFLPAYAIKRFDAGGGRSMAVGFIGLVLRNTPEIVTPSGVADLLFVDEAEAANQLLRGPLKDVNAIVVLIHEGATTTGGYNDKSCPGLSGAIKPIIDRLDPRIDVVISGHTHQAYNCNYGGRLLTSASAQGRVLSDIDLTLDRATGEVLTASADNLIVVNDVGVNPLPAQFPPLARDPAQTAILDVYRPLVAPKANAVIGSIGADLLDTPNDAGESSLGDIVADAQLAAMSAGADPAAVAFMNPGGIRARLLQAQISGGESRGEVTYGEAFTVQPFGNVVTKLTLSGAQIKALLEQQSFSPTAPRLLQVSRGFSYAWDALAPVGSKVVAGSIRINGVSVVATQRYRIAVSNFLADGGDGYSVFAEGSERVGGPLDIDALVDYFAAHSPVVPGPQDRITRRN